jgi:hypothetical protein
MTTTDDRQHSGYGQEALGVPGTSRIGYSTERITEEPWPGHTVPERETSVTPWRRDPLRCTP